MKRYFNIFLKARAVPRTVVFASYTLECRQRCFEIIAACFQLQHCRHYISLAHLLYFDQ
jgi:hypothetical protein